MSIDDYLTAAYDPYVQITPRRSHAMRVFVLLSETIYESDGETSILFY